MELEETLFIIIIIIIILRQLGPFRAFALLQNY
jgi:hypothetical protein